MSDPWLLLAIVGAAAVIGFGILGVVNVRDRLRREHVHHDGPHPSIRQPGPARHRPTPRPAAHLPRRGRWWLGLDQKDKRP